MTIKPRLVGLIALALTAASPAFAGGQRLIPGKPGNFVTMACLRASDMQDIATYARRHADNGKVEYELKRKSGLCGLFDSTRFGADSAVIDQVIGKFNDKPLGEVFIVKFHATSGASKTFLYGIIRTDQLALVSL